MYFPLLLPDYAFEMRAERLAEQLARRQTEEPKKCSVNAVDRIRCYFDCYMAGGDEASFDNETQCVCKFKSKYTGEKYNMPRHWRACDK